MVLDLIIRFKGLVIIAGIIATLVLVGRCREEQNLNPAPSYSECFNCGSERGFQKIRQGFPPSIHYECKDCRAIR
jgi:hypothetical protein